MLSGEATQLLDDEAALLTLFEDLALAAGRAIMEHYETGVSVEEKADASPVTEADRAAERIILTGLRATLAGAPCVSEEEASGGVLPVCGDDGFLLVDPLDGTREFIGRRPDFTVNIALVREGTPVAGVVYAPARGVLYSGRPGAAFEVETRDGKSIAGRREISARPAHTPPAIVASRSHSTPETEAFIARYPGAETVSVGSSLKFCMLARGDADLYPRFGRTMQWDTAAGDAVLRAAGGRTLTLDGTLFTYGPKGGEGLEAFANPFFIAEGRAAE
ncbi:3'(2'),5'-bisphosphate nucleotidase CysQ [Chelativorans salis]|uniref:3'(2'),5'-bisphosphate nucleotidase CysQ n=1 Tax=Chelativorans salis TaxID=2978478 RepID=A0ABT2LGB8_9HYPH|nr:3'(2'),5'-bisphosphate nucleotidase CysQ [Chelativorans sp. EGI FJ00035]MCT7373522.1 3'(2'),5'-bisphosphate nucleotidase CysQ [Chelativorans sp. EGI FJ00035]